MRIQKVAKVTKSPRYRIKVFTLPWGGLYGNLQNYNRNKHTFLHSQVTFHVWTRNGNECFLGWLIAKREMFCSKTVLETQLLTINIHRLTENVMRSIMICIMFVDFTRCHMFIGIRDLRTKLTKWVSVFLCLETHNISYN